MKNKIGIINDKEDLIIKITNDPIINITGMIGSGKTTLAKKIRQEKNMELVSLDWLFGYSIEDKPEPINKLIKKIESMYIETKGQTIFNYSNNRIKDKKIEKNYKKYTNKIYKVILEEYKKTQMIIEGRHIYKYIELKDIKGTLIIKRTSLLHAYKQALIRDVFKKWKKGNNKQKIIKKFLRRIKFPLKDYIQINKFIKEVMLMKDNLS